jgi:hypothetical protein
MMPEARKKQFILPYSPIYVHLVFWMLLTFRFPQKRHSNRILSYKPISSETGEGKRRNVIVDWYNRQLTLEGP